MMEITIESPENIREAARRFLAVVGNTRHFAFDAPMGAGKTTFISALCRELGMEEEASSPTFSIINEYRSADGHDTVYHFDFYRIESPEEALDMGLDDYFDSDSRCFIEWPENIGALLPDDTLRVAIRINPDNTRTLLFPEP